jgi:hypothetical protein
MLGVRRTTETIAARLLQSAGLIRYRRGHIQIIDRKAVEDISCECYAVVRHNADKVFPQPGILGAARPQAGGHRRLNALQPSSRSTRAVRLHRAHRWRSGGVAAGCAGAPAGDAGG